jgi:hypothetical protein
MERCGLSTQPGASETAFVRSPAAEGRDGLKIRKYLIAASAAMTLACFGAPALACGGDQEYTLYPDGTSGCGPQSSVTPLVIQGLSDEIDLTENGDVVEDPYWQQQLQMDTDAAPRGDTVADTQIFTFQRNGNGTATATMVAAGTVTYSVTTIVTGRVVSEHTRGTTVTGRDRNNNGRPDVLERAERSGTLTYTPTGSRIKRSVDISN